MTYREALAAGIESLLARETIHDLQAAKVLQRKLSRLKASALVKITDRDWCDCGERKRPDRHFCEACSAAFPLKLFSTWLTGRGPASQRAWRQMKAIAQNRLAPEAMRRAA